MKLIKLVVLAIIIFSLGSCEKGFFSDCIQPEGSVETRDYDFGSFDELSVNIASKVTIIESSRNTVTITAAVNILDRIDEDSDKSEEALSIEIDGCSRFNNDDVNIIVQMVNVQSLTINSSAELVSKSVLITPKNLTLNVRGSGGMNLQIERANELDADISGSGEINISGIVKESQIDIIGSGDFIGDKLFSKSAEIKIVGSGEALIQVSKSIDMNLSGSCKIAAFGTAESQEINSNGSASVLNQELISENTTINHSGSGIIEVNTTENLNITSSGSGDVCYVGSPQLTVEVYGIGKVSKCN